MTNLPDETITPQPWLAVVRPQPIRLIVMHATRGDVIQELQYTATKNWLLSPDNGNQKWGSSTNRVISHEGQMCTCWPDDMSPTYSAGFGDDNTDWAIDWYAISFELAQRSFDEEFAEPTLARAAKEVAQLCQKHNIPPVWLDHVDQSAAVPTGITGHENTDNGIKLGKTDPGVDLAKGGKFDSDAFIQRVLTEMSSLSGTVSQPVAPSQPNGGARRRHTIAAGENLFRIALLYYQDGSRWPEIYAANKPVIGEDPTRIRINMELEIPA